MRDIKELLDRYRSFRPPHRAIVKEAIRLIARCTPYTIDAEDITVRNGTVFVSASPHAKQCVFLNKKTILTGLQEVFGARAVKDIR